MREAFLLMPTACTYIPMAVFFKTSETASTHTAAMMMGVGIKPM